MRACAEHPSPTGPLSGVMPPLAWLVGRLLTSPGSGRAGEGRGGLQRVWAVRQSRPCLPAPSHQRKDRPVSSEGLLSQPNVAHPPSPSEMGNRPADVDAHLDVPPGEGLEEPTRGPRSTTAH